MTARFLDALDIIELVSILEFLVGWLGADLDHARARLPLYGTDNVDDLRADTARLTKTLEATR